MRAVWIAVLLTFTVLLPARAYDFPPLQPLDEQGIAPDMLNDMFGTWELRGAKGKKRCRVTLLNAPGIGGRQIEVAPGCYKTFPVMGDIIAWRLQQNWTIDLIDALRKTKLRLHTPDERYIASGDDKDVAGIDEFIKVETKAPKKK